MKSPRDLSGRDLADALCRSWSYVEVGQTGSHIILRHSSGRRLTVPNHGELAKGTLRALIREAGLTKEQFAELL